MVMTPERRIVERRIPVRSALRRKPLWSLIAWGLIVEAAVEGAALTFAPARYFTSPAYDGVKAFPGLIPCGLTLLALAVGLAYCIAEDNPDRLSLVLAVGAAYEIYWLVALMSTWLTTGIFGLTGPPKAALFSWLYVSLWRRVDERQGV